MELAPPGVESVGTLPKSVGLREERVGLEYKGAMPPKGSTPKMLHRAGELRKEPTPAESKLWAYLRALRDDGVHFRRQHAIGPYIVDFCAPRRKLIIELDGPPFGRNTSISRNTMMSERRISDPKAIMCCASGTAM